MKTLYFGNKENKKIILVHGFQAPYHMWQDYIDYYKQEYCVVVPILQGHYIGSEDFINFESSVKEFEDYYIKNFGKDVYAVYAVSMGGVFATTLFSRDNVNIQKLVPESVPLLPFGKIIAYFAKKQYISLSKKMKERDPKSMTKLVNGITDKKLYNEFLIVLDNMTETTIKNYIDDILTYKFPSNIQNNETEIYYYYGGVKEEIAFKISAAYLRRYYPQSKIVCIKGKKHCEGVIAKPQEKIEMLDKILKN